MVEMTETASILHNATPNSLVLIDEIGRGTSTFDGMAIAWACAEYLASHIQSFTLFATHYFELIQLADTYKNIQNVHAAAIEDQNTIVFLHKIKPGGIHQSYGIQVAALAGLPACVIQNARKKCLQHESFSKGNINRVTAPPHIIYKNHPVMNQLLEADIHHMTPMDALQFLHKLQTKMRDTSETEIRD